MNLIRDTIEHAMGGSTTMQFNPGGLEIRLHLPLTS
jgi:hypothetical protein